MLLEVNNSDTDANDLQNLSEWILNIGDGKIDDTGDGYGIVSIHDDMLITDAVDPIVAMVEATNPEIQKKISNFEYLHQRAILALTLDMVEMINNYMVAMNNQESRDFFSLDTICKYDGDSDILDQLHTPKFLNSIKCSGVPNYLLSLKVGTPVILLRNIDPSFGLCNGTRLVLTRLGNRVLEAKMISGPNTGEIIFIPRMTLTLSDPRLPFKFQRRQFPIMVSYAMTINKSQGQWLSNVGIVLRKSVFTHGQLYVIVSRVTNRKGLKILIYDSEGYLSKETTNVVYQEVFRNLY